MADDDERPDIAPWPYGPITDPPDRFAHLSAKTRKWIADLREDDIDEIKSAIKFYRRVSIWSGVSKWMIVTAVVVFLGMVGIGEAVLKALSWFRKVAGA